MSFKKMRGQEIKLHISALHEGAILKIAEEQVRIEYVHQQGEYMYFAGEVYDKHKVIFGRTPYKGASTSIAILELFLGDASGFQRDTFESFLCTTDKTFAWKGESIHAVAEIPGKNEEKELSIEIHWGPRGKRIYLGTEQETKKICVIEVHRDKKSMIHLLVA